VPPVRAASVPLGDEVRVGHRLAELLRAVRSGAPQLAPRPELRDGARGDPLPALRWASRSRIPRRAAAHAPALLHELRLADVLPGGSRAAARGAAGGIARGVPRLIRRGASQSFSASQSKITVAPWTR